MRIIDFHTHIYPQKVAKKATDIICKFYDIDGDGMCGTAEQLMERGDMVGISEFVILPVANKAEQVRSINHFIVEQAAENSRFYGFGTVHVEMENICDEIEYIKSNGLLGVKIHPDTQQFDIDDERLFPMYEMICGKLPILIHMGDKRYDYSHPARLRRVLDKFPNLQVIAAHFGGWSMQKVAYNYLKDTNCSFDISSMLRFMEPGEPEHYIKAYGAERILYGTDYPVWDPAIEVKRFLSLALTDAEMEKIAYKNALEILKKN